MPFLDYPIENNGEVIECRGVPNSEKVCPNLKI